MKYISTRGGSQKLSFIEVATTGLAKDGGLFVPENIPAFSKEEISSWKNLDYKELAEKIISPFIDGEIDENDLKTLINKSYSTFDSTDIAPLKQLSENKWILELFHGPTLAFKDFALQFLGNLLDYILDKQKREVVIIGATSGDTGSAAIEGCKNCRHVNLFMLHPYNRVSEVQRRQMTTVLSGNIHNIAVEGNFDDCQELVKEMFRSPGFTGKKELVAVNSINWVRIMAQIVYYFYAALKTGSPEKEVSFSVPTGNFGDVFAGFIACKMGLPIKKLIVATNQNDILHRFFSHNDYSKKKVAPTFSPSMDIQISSNFERLLFYIYEQNGKKVLEIMQKFADSGNLSVKSNTLEKIRTIFSSSSTSDDETISTIKEIYKKHSYLVDPHTATGINAAKDYDKPIIILSTASPAKFPEVVKKAVKITPELPTHITDLMKKEERCTKLENNIKKIKSYIADNA